MSRRRPAHQDDDRALSAVCDVDALCRQIVEHSPDCIKVLDSRTHLLWMNEQGRRLMEVCDLQSVIGQCWLDFWAGEARADASAAVATALDGGTGRFTGPCPTARGVLKWWNVAVTRIDDERGVRLLVISRDVSEIVALAQSEKNIAAAERAAKAEAERANRSKDAVLCNVSHELRAPLVAILGWSALLSSDAPPEMGEAIGAIQDAARQQMEVVQDLLDAARQQGVLPLEAEPVVAATIVHEVLRLLRPAIAAKRLDVQLEGDGCGALVLGDARQLTRAVWNLIGNAVKFTTIGGMVRVEVGVSERTVRLIIADSGPGLEPEWIPHVFERFWRADAGPGAAEHGLGLGLAIVRSVVELHGGEVEAYSDGLGRGCRFTVRLPLLEQADTCAQAEEQDGSEPVDQLADSVVDLTGIKVLLVQRDRPVRQTMSSLLGELGATVRTADQWDRAITTLRTGDVSVVVVDDDLDPNGPAACAECARGASDDAVPVVVLVDPASTSRVHPASRCTRLVKPIPVRSLARRIQELARRSRASA